MKRPDSASGLEWLVELRDAVTGRSAEETRRVYLRRALGHLREAREEIRDGVAPEVVAKTLRTAARYARCAPPAPRRQQLALVSTDYIESERARLRRTGRGVAEVRS